MTPYMRVVTNHLQSCATRLGLGWDVVPELKALRRQAKTLRALFERECSDSTADPEWLDKRQATVKQTIAKKCKALGLEYYIQGDCRGAALYVSKEPIPANNYNQAVCIDAE